MICKRFAFIVVYCALFGLYPADSWAKKQNGQTIKTVEIFSSLTSANRNPNSLTSTSNALKSAVVVTPLTVKATSKAIAQVDVVEREPSKINRRWFWVAIGATSGISLFLLWLLFRKPQQSTKSLTRSNTEKFEPKKTKVESVNFESRDRSSSIEGNIHDLSKVETNINPTAKNNITQVARVATPIENVDVVCKLVQHLQEPSHNLITTKVVAPSQNELRRKAIRKLAEVGDYRNIEPLLKIMFSVEVVDKDLIFEAVNQIINRSLEPTNQKLFANLQHEDPQMRLNAIRDLKQLYQFASPAISKIAAMESDPDYEVRQTATQTLRQLNVNPIPPLSNYSNLEIDRLVSGEKSKANLHLVAYLLAELDVDERC